MVSKGDECIGRGERGFEGADGGGWRLSTSHFRAQLPAETMWYDCWYGSRPSEGDFGTGILRTEVTE